jgi:hypothetical protein
MGLSQFITVKVRPLPNPPQPRSQSSEGEKTLYKRSLGFEAKPAFGEGVIIDWEKFSLI